MYIKRKKYAIDPTDRIDYFGIKTSQITQNTITGAFIPAPSTTLNLPVFPPQSESPSTLPLPIITKATTSFTTIIKQCNPEIDVSLLKSIPITQPQTPVGNQRRDNINNELILSTEMLIGTSIDPTQTVGKMINSRYRIVGSLGCGAFGQVVKAIDLQNDNREVAIKVLKNKPIYMRQGMLELAILHLLNTKFDKDNSANILRLYDHFVFYNHICIVNELLGMNLYELIKQRNYQGLKLNTTISILKQLGEALCVLYRNNIIHCDLKPENILLVNNTQNIKLIDFGSSCFENSTLYTYIQSRHYRAPEVILGLPYNCAIDMWSYGCIAAEMILGIPLFPGSSEYNQLERMIKMIGAPPKYVLEQGKNTRKYFNKTVDGWVFKTREEFEVENNCRLEPNKNYHPYTSLPHFVTRLNHDHLKEKVLKLVRQSYLDLLQRTLTWDPEIRMTPYQILHHPFLNNKPLPANYQPMREMPFNKQFPGDYTMTADDALKMVAIPFSVQPHKLKFQTYTTQTYYQVFMTALEKNIVLNILSPRPFDLQPMTPPVLAWEEVNKKRRIKEMQQEKRNKKKGESPAATFSGKVFYREGQTSTPTNRHGHMMTYNGENKMYGQHGGGRDSMERNGMWTESPRRERNEQNQSPAKSWSRKHPMYVPKD